MYAFPKLTARVPRPVKGERIYAIGDVHGRYDLLIELLDQIISHFPTLEPKPSKFTVLLLGNLIDHGPENARCIELAKALSEEAKAMTLLGFHEHLLLESLDGKADAQEAWLSMGGVATLESYGLGAPKLSEDPFDFAERLEEGLPDGHIAFLKSLDTSYSSGSYFFAHAGIKPGVSIAKQSREALFSVGSEFTLSDRWHGQVVVHGHSTVDEVEVYENRIAIDTGAYKTGTLSALCLQDKNIEVIAT
ncbi:MAG: metallophosphoesterase [Pseudomonadota bacterium]